MNKLMIGVVGGALMLTAGTAMARPMQMAQQPLVYEQAHVPQPNGMEAIAVIKNNRGAERTVACRDTADVLATFHPEAIAFQPVRGPHGKVKTDEDVAGVETFTPVAFQNCTVARGNQFQQDVTQAVATQP
ncbi:hypothetical protein [Sphingomonas yabuuchiae]|uniref:hypothetical protein n=1 Tax=Sphingomonas yabuuchiae TaxID=172044 RepID=UPI001F95ADF6|nr:hypothetical protein [uncultured Sphingomonas sp.]HIV77473.1 hypothetical protein [Candidatus Sphingomonas excrementigallinarum]